MLALVMSIGVMATQLEDQLEDNINAGETYVNGGSNAAPTGDAESTSNYYPTSPNFPGPRYGRPGYKESHNWESAGATDQLSPLVFNWREYAAMQLSGPAYDVCFTNTGCQEAATKAYLNMSATANAPNCLQSSFEFNANAYKAANSQDASIGNSCSGITAHYLSNGIYEGLPLSKNPPPNPQDHVKIPMISPLSGHPSNQVPQVLVKPGQYFPGVPLNGNMQPNSFAPARHLTVSWWMKITAAQTSSPTLGEFMGYGGQETDNYFRTGFGCLKNTGQATAFYNCFFIFVFSTVSTGDEYFHTYHSDNWQKATNAMLGAKWAHFTSVLSTKGVTESPMTCESLTEAVSSGNCNGLFEFFVNGQNHTLIDWNHGSDKHDASNAMKSPVAPIWNLVEQGTAATKTIRRFFVSPPKKSTDVDQNTYKIGYPWANPWNAGMCFCDMSTISGVWVEKGSSSTATARARIALALYKRYARLVVDACPIAC